MSARESSFQERARARGLSSSGAQAFLLAREYFPWVETTARMPGAQVSPAGGSLYHSARNPNENVFSRLPRKGATGRG